jgi:hypothetical protein
VINPADLRPVTEQNTGSDPNATSVIRPGDLQALSEREAAADPGATSAINQADLQSFVPSSASWEEPAASAPFRPAEAPQIDTWSPSSQSTASSSAWGSTSTALVEPGAITTISGSGFPAQVEFAVAPTNNRLYAIPIVGYLARGIMLIPHIIVLYLLFAGAAVLQLVIWAPVLFSGAYPSWGYSYNVGLLRWMTRVQAYFYGLTDLYPPFSFGWDDRTGYPVSVAIDMPQTPVKGWAIPIVGYVAKLVMLIPHIIALYVLGAIAGLIYLIAWVPVLSGGRYPDWGYQIVGGYLRWSVRVAAYFLGLTDQYPPFQLAS